jgi:tetratricopeptide (TPR) repeat protein
MMRLTARAIVVVALAVAMASGAGRPWAGSLALRYQEAWYLENGLQEVAQAAKLYREVAAARRAGPALAARALLRLAACYRHLGNEDAASRAELTARRRFPEEIKKFPTYRLGVLHKQLDEAFDVRDAATAAQAIERFLAGLDVATVHSICEACYDHAAELRGRRPLASVAALRKAIAISTYLRQLERSAFAQKGIGDIYLAAGRTDEAIAAYRKVQENFPTCRNAAAWAVMSVAEVHRLRGRLAEAVEAYRAVERDYPSQLPQVLWANLWMGDAFRAAGKLADARAVWRRVLEEFNEPDYADQIAIAARLLGQAVIEPVPEAPIPPRDGLGAHARSRGPRHRQGESPPLAVPEDEFANDTAYFLGIQHEMAGRRDEAVTCYRRCIALSKGHDWPRALAVKALEGEK